MGMIQEFKDFAARGNMVDLAVGMIMGTAFGACVKSLVDDVIMPPVGWLASGVNFNDMSAKLNVPGATKPVEIFYGKFINMCITFLIVSFCVFMLVKVMNKVIKKKDEGPPKPTKSEELLAEIRDALKKK